MALKANLVNTIDDEEERRRREAEAAKKQQLSKANATQMTRAEKNNLMDSGTVVAMTKNGVITTDSSKKTAQNYISNVKAAQQQAAKQPVVKPAQNTPEKKDLSPAGPKTAKDYVSQKGAGIANLKLGGAPERDYSSELPKRDELKAQTQLKNSIIGNTIDAFKRQDAAVKEDVNLGNREDVKRQTLSENNLIDSFKRFAEGGTPGETARDRLINERGEKIAEVASGNAAPTRSGDGLTPWQRQRNEFSQTVADSYGYIDEALKGGLYDSPIDNQMASMIGEFINAPGMVASQIGRAVGAAVKGGENAPEWRRQLGFAIENAYLNSDAYERQANIEKQRAFAKEQDGTLIGGAALDLASGINSMLVSLAYCNLLGLNPKTSISKMFGIQGGAEKTNQLLDEGCNPLVAIGAGIAWGKVTKAIEGASSFGKVQGGIVEQATKKIGDKAVKLAGQFVDGKTVASVVNLAKGPIAKRILSGMGEGNEELAEYCIEYVFDSLLGREDVSFDVKEGLYSWLIGALCGEIFEFKDLPGLPAEIAYSFSEEGRAARAAEVKEYLDGIDPRILSSAKTGNLDAVEAVMKNVTPEKAEEATEEFEITEAEKKAEKNASRSDNEISVGKATTIKNPYSGKTPVKISDAAKNVVTVSDKDFAEANGFYNKFLANRDSGGATKGLKTALEDIFRRTGGIRSVKVKGVAFDGSDYYVTVARKVAGKLASDPHKSAEKIAVFNNIDEIIENAEFVGSGEFEPHGSENSKNRTVTRYDYFETDVNIGGKPYIVSFDVEVIPGHNNYRTHKVIEKINLIENTSGEAGPEPTAQVHQLGYSGDISATNIIPSISEKSNPYGEKTTKGGAEAVPSEPTDTMKRADNKMSVDDWKETAGGINAEFDPWVMKDPARVFDSAAKGNPKLRQRLFELYEKPLNEAQGSYAKNLKSTSQKIADEFKTLGIKEESPESAAVQWIGEGKRQVNKNGDTVEYTLDDLKKDFPGSWKQIKEGADFCRGVYDDYLLKLNQMYEEIYPATREQAEKQVRNLEDRNALTRQKVENFEKLREEYLNIKGKLETEISKKKENTLVYTNTANRILEIEKRIERVDDIIKRYEDRIASKRMDIELLKMQIENGEILRNKQIRKRNDYFHHFQELTSEFAQIADIFANDQRIPASLAGKSENTKPRTIWTGIAQARSNQNYYAEDAVGGILRYSGVAEKLLAFDPVISRFRDVTNSIRTAGTMLDEEKAHAGNNAGQFASWADKLTNQIAGKTNFLDRVISDNTGKLGRATMKTIQKLNSRVKSNAILGNVRSALVQIGNIPNAALYMPNPLDWARGGRALISSIKSGDSTIKDARASSNFMNRRYMDDGVEAITKDIQKGKLTDKPKEFALWMLGAGDRAASEVIWHTAYSKGVSDPAVLERAKNGFRDYESAVDYADDITRRSVAGRGEGDIPIVQSSNIVGLVAPFQIEVTNSFNAFKEQVGKKNAAGVIAFELSTFIMNCAFEQIFSDRPLGFDFISAVLDAIKEAGGDDEEEEKDIFKDAVEVAKLTGSRSLGELLSGMPFGTQIANIITGGDEQRAENWFGDNDPTRYGTGNIGISALGDIIDLGTSVAEGEKTDLMEWIDTLAPVALPWGGKQLSRTIQGAEQIIKGGNYGTDKDGQEYLKYLQDDDVGNTIKTLLFGKYAGDNAQEYIDSGFKRLSADETAAMEKAENFGIPKNEFYDLVLGLKEYKKDAEKREALLANDNFTAEEKYILNSLILEGNGTKPQYILERAIFNPGLEKETREALNAGITKDRFYEEIIGLKNYGSQEKKQEALFGESGLDAYQKGVLDRILIGGEKTRDYTDAESFRWSGLTAKQQSYEKNGVSEELAKTIEEIKKEQKGAADIQAAIKAETGCSDIEAYRLYKISENNWLTTVEDLDDDDKKRLESAKAAYGIDDDMYVLVKNWSNSGESEKDEYDNSISGTAKEDAITNIMAAGGLDYETAKRYYTIVNSCQYDRDGVSSAALKDFDDLEQNYGWTEEECFRAYNALKFIDSTKKEDMIAAIKEAGFTTQEATGYYNLYKNNDYYKKSGPTTYAYGMSNQKQVDKAGYFLANYNSDGSVTSKDISAWYKAAAGCKKKAEYIAAYQSAGATYQQALTFYNLMKGNDKSFNAWYKENGGD